MAATEVKIATIQDIIFRNKENGYTIAVMENEEELFTVTGCFPFADRGRRFELVGSWKIHPTYGEQFDAAEMKELMPTSASGIEEFLASGAVKGIGKKTAAIIVRQFGTDTLSIIENQPERLVEIDGIGEKKAFMIGEAFKSKKELSEVSLFLQQFGIPSNYAIRLYNEYGVDAMEIVSHNPYQLVNEFFGIGFKRADAIAQKMGVAKDDEERIKSGIRFTLNYYISEGHTFAPQKLLCEKAGELLDLSSENVYDILVYMAFDGDVHIETLEGQSVVFLMPYFMAEQNVCKKLLALNQAPLKLINTDIDSLIQMTEASKGIELSENQKFAVKSSLVNGISVITGGPGTGKTTIINAIMSVLENSGLSTAIAAPTGRAAKRITETSGYMASTIHRLLEYYYSEEEDTMRFGKTEENPLEYDVIIIDEASMIDILLMNGLMNALTPGTRLIFVGDADQLPSVGAGNVLRDIINSEVIYSVKLTEIFRQAKESLIVVNAHKINRGEEPDFNEKDKDFFFLQRNGEREMLDSIKDLCVRRLPNYFTGCNPLKDMQVLTPVRKGLLGSIHLNKELQMVLNPPDPELAEQKFGDKIFRVNDKVMQIKNNYQMTWKKIEDFTEGQGIFNGDVGFISHIDKEFNEVVVIFDDNKYVTYDVTQLDELELAYAVTVHKSQGSEFPIVIMPISWFPPILATRNLLYTAVTRGKEAVVLVGSKNKMQGMIENNRITDRYTGLKARLKSVL
ncbi:SF1B family DNA helicase RecD2 [Clostridium aminobutyricum]|uniref:ATP-dependent RecD2 DNA helicase n=1 Tax=Clostridium aminobutyricum TaxID=33953 RepID=A0A939D9E3_CLOAM|nr:ATP-dependent RecD-like DNA helicase [Clostridium aminobutyricum]MBN7773859.1 ATP-dependent RecD-like DNA helicase [Clostridium aminobutyricum]